VDIETEVTPTVGTEEQSEELARQMSSELESDPQKMWAMSFFGKPLVGLFISQDSADRQLVIDMAQQFLIINSVLYIPLLFVNIVRFSIQGLGYTMIAMIAGMMELVGRAVVAMLLVPSLGYDAACFANPVAWILADLFLFPCYFTCIRKLQKRLYPEKAAASSK